MMTTIASSSLFDDNLVQIKQEPQEDIWELASGGKNCSIIKSSTVSRNGSFITGDMMHLGTIVETSFI